ncbi:gliding motility-associated C-terminal domain-containing protein [Puia sp. P3]|uniref:T9SS type B sorting domain-containing protein n=1 Tax=Puia sp. P3 TaxID=3423952 RepID=UPI003D66958F
MMAGRCWRCGPFDSYHWSTGETGQEINVKQAGVYSLTVTDEKGCQGTESIIIYEKPCVKEIYVPSGFTPNGDGKNDIFRPMVFRKPVQYRFVVYNRWGIAVFETADPPAGLGWKDGRECAGEWGLCSGVVIISLRAVGQKLERGTVVLVR